MVALLGFLDVLQVLVEIFLRKERGAVNALELRILLVAQPVGTGDVEQLERLDPPGRGNVRPSAEVGELASLVDRDLLVGLGELLDEVALHEVAFRLEAFEPLAARQKLARVGQVLLRQLLHLLLDGFEVLGRERLLAVKVVEESALGRWTVAELGFGEEFKHRRRHQVRGGMPIDFQRLGIALGQNAQLGIFFQGPCQINETRLIGVGAVAAGAVAVRGQRLHLRYQGCVSQTRADVPWRYRERRSRAARP